MEAHILTEYDYILPSELIAHEPARIRDEARLFVYDTARDAVTFDTFKNLARYLPEKSILVLNDTKVVPAKISGVVVNGRAHQGQRPVELLCLLNEPRSTDGGVYALSQNKIRNGSIVRLSDTYAVEIVRKEGERFVVKPSGEEPLETILESVGEAPLPPYIEPTQNSDVLKKRYQTVFANKGASVAAPTASLHFTDEVFESLERNHIQKYCATLEVGMGTFAPVWEEHLQKNKLHTEWYQIPYSTGAVIHASKKNRTQITAVGTTVARMLESAAAQILAKDFTENGIATTTELFIRPGFEFKIVDHLLTNFHVPRSSLMSLVDAFLVHKESKKRILELYREAIEVKYRFYSFGDSMLIL